jgi:hypothetical protein
MSVLEVSSEAVESAATTLALSQLFSVTSAGTNPAYVVLNALDRNEYTAASNSDTGSFSGDGATLDFSQLSGDGRGAGIVFAWQSSSDSYVNATYGSLTSIDYTASDNPSDITNISLFGTSNYGLAQQDAGNAYALMQQDASGYIGSATVATEPSFSAAVPAAATPDGIAAVATSFVGKAWNEEGCWVLASTIAAEAGASLPVQSTAIGVPGQANGEWIVLYNGPAGGSNSTNWQSLVSTGDVVTFGTPGGGGHVTTCVSGSGSNAMLVDNIQYINGQGQTTNPANDGSSNDIVIAPPHAASQEWAGVAASSVVIYALDTPIVKDTSATATLVTAKSLSLSSAFSATDPGHKSITKYQAYVVGGDKITLNGAVQSASGTASAVSASSLSALSLLAGTAAGADTVYVRAYNGAYWGDWQSLSVTVNAPPPKPPTLSGHTPNQIWKQGSQVNLLLPSNLFADPQHETLSYAVAGTAGAALPSWLSFTSATESFTGIVPASPTSFGVVVTASDTSNLSASETFTVTVPAAAPVLADRTTSQTVQEGGTVDIALPQGSFTDPQNEALSYKATQSNGAALPSWLAFSPSTLTFSGTAPAKPASLSLKVTATDSSNLSASETIGLAVTANAASLLAGGDWLGDFVSYAAPAEERAYAGWSRLDAGQVDTPLDFALHLAH